jgi:hypothetical protein
MPAQGLAFRHTLGECGRASPGSTEAGAVSGLLSYGAPEAKAA